MSNMVATGGVNETSGIFVSRAKGELSLAQDILALYCGTRNEFGIYGQEPVLMTASLSDDDLKQIFREWGIFNTGRGNLRILAHYLYRRLGKRCTTGTYVAPKADLLRCRDLMAYSNVEVGGGRNANAKWWRPAEIYDGISFTCPYASWQNRFMQIYQMIELVDDQLVGIPHWEDLRSAALFRGVNLGGLIDYTSQRVIGSHRNLAYFTGTDVPRKVLSVALSLVVNWSYYHASNPHLLGFGFSWCAPDGLEGPHFDEANGLELVNDEMLDRDRAAPFGLDVWWVESRGNWAGCQSPDVLFPVILNVDEFRRGDVVRQGNLTVYTSETKQTQMDRILSVSEVSTMPLRYHYVNSAGATTHRVWLTNNTNPPVFLKWHTPLDLKLRGYVEGARLRAIETRDVQFTMSYNSADTFGRFDTLDAFSGLSSGF
jgi:hypothetical protein